jgi:hypothetical protein
MAALAGLAPPLAHAGTAGLVVEASAAFGLVAVTLAVWLGTCN